MKHKVIWECESLTLSETDPHGDLYERDTNPIEGWAVHKGDYDNNTSCLQKWHSAVGLYTAGKLTFESDKLIAISGVARYLKDTLWKNDDIQYHAGLWSHEFEWHLLWSTNSHGSRAIQYRAPSWSWASYNGSLGYRSIVEWQNPCLLSKTKAIHVEYDDDPYGNALSGYIRICGPMCSAKLTPRRHWVHLQPPDVTVELSCLSLDDLSSIQTIEIYLLGVAKGTGWQGCEDLQGLVLQPTGTRAGEYKRIGYFHNHDAGPSSEATDDSWYSDRAKENAVYRALFYSFGTMSLSEELYESRDLVQKTYEIIMI